MATPIETQVHESLMALESLITACRSAGEVMGHHHNTVDGSYSVYYLTELLEAKFEAFHVLISQQVMPLVKDIKTMGQRV